jgi:antirestriction protein
MENQLEDKESNKHNIFSNINFVKNNKINFNYCDCVHQIKNVSNNLENFIEHIDDSILKDFSISKKDYQDDKIDKNDFIINDLKRRPFSVKYVRKSNKLFRNKSVEIKEEKKKVFLNSVINR